ncbi:hypothetical protein Tco_1206526, partial [Tanacetum coccineum]
SAIVFATSSSEYSSWSENKSKSGDLDSSILSVLKCFLDDQNSRSGSFKGVNSSLIELLVMHYLKQGINYQYAVFNKTEYAILIFLNEYAVLDKKVEYAVSNGSEYAISGYRPEQCIRKNN